MNNHKNLPFYIVDVFAEKKYGGNQLAVVMEAGGLSSDTMQKIALEMNYSETTFILNNEPTEEGFAVRIFSLDEELPFAGHPTLGTAFIIQQKILKESVAQITLKLPVGSIPVKLDYENDHPTLLTMKQVAPVFGQTFGATEAAAALGLEPSSVDQRFPIEEVSTGLPFIIIPLKNLESVKKSSVDLQAYHQLIARAEAKSLLVFCPETYHRENQINCRMFDHYHGIPEDPATGSAAGCLASWLVKHRYFGSEKVKVRAEQGYEIKRPSLLLLEAKEEKGVISVFVGGGCILTAQGELL